MDTNKEWDRERSHNPDQDARMHPAPAHASGQALGDKSREGTEEAADGKSRDASGYMNDLTGQEGKASPDQDWNAGENQSGRNK